MCTSNGTFTFPNGVSVLRITACAAGEDGGNGGIKSAGGNGGNGGTCGDYIIDAPHMVTPGHTLNVTVGDGNTVVTGVMPGISLVKGGKVCFSVRDNNAGSTFSFGVGGNGGRGAAGNSGSMPSNSLGGGHSENYRYKGGTNGQHTNEYGAGGGGGGGGSSPWGAGGSGGYGGYTSTNGCGTAGTNGTGFGAGGGGGGGNGSSSGTNDTSAIGGKGSPGFVLIEW